MKPQFLIASALLLAACDSDDSAKTSGSAVVASNNVEIYVVDKLDNIQNGYCIDIAKGKGSSANPADGLQAHTCY